MKFTIDLQRTGFAGDALTDYLSSLQAVCEKYHTDFIVVGAFARDLLLEQLFQAPGGPATRDVDIAIYLESWTEFDSIIKDLLSEHGMRRGRAAHEFYSRQGIKSDILPYGKIEKNRQVSFVEHPDKALNMLGFSELRSFGIVAVVNEDLSFIIPPPEGIILIKAFAWNDRAPDIFALKHVYDIGLIIEGFYLAFIEEIAPLPEYADVFEVIGPDFHSAKYSAVVLGRRLRKMLPAEGEAITGLRTVLSRMLSERMREQVLLRLASAIAGTEHNADDVLQLLLAELA